MVAHEKLVKLAGLDPRQQEPKQPVGAGLAKIKTATAGYTGTAILEDNQSFP